MLPIICDITKLRIAVIGDGPATAKRLSMVKQAGCDPIYCQTLDEAQKITAVDVAFVADFNDQDTEMLYRYFKSIGAWVNAEDKRTWCDFHVPAMVRRGDLLLTVSTGGKSPRLARRIRHMLERLFPPIWGERLAKIGAVRDNMKQQGASFQALAEKTDALLDEKGWLKADCACLRGEDS